MPRRKVKKLLSFMMTFIIIVTLMDSTPINKVKADNAAPYLKSSEYEVPQSHTEWAILADEYQYQQGHKAVAGYGEIDNWAFYQTVLFPADQAEDVKGDIPKNFDNSSSLVTVMNKYGNPINKTDPQGNYYYDNWRFANTGSDNKSKVVPPTYDYTTLTYWTTINILGVDCRIGYKIDSSTFTVTTNGMQVPWSQRRTDYPGEKFIHFYHANQVTANPIHTAPTADFNIQDVGGNNKTEFNPSKDAEIDIIDGKKDGTFADKNDLYWSAHMTFDDADEHTSDGTEVSKTGRTIKQSWGYDNAVITNAGWSVTNSSGQNVNDLFNASAGLNNGGSSNVMKLKVSKDTPSGEYTVHHTVTDSWGRTSQEQTKTFTISNSNILTVHYVDDSTGTNIGSKEPTSDTGKYSVDSSLIPSTYTLDGNANVDSFGGTSITNAALASTGVDISQKSRDVYILCKKNQSPVNPGGGGGNIIFIPNQFDWTNKFKSGESQGSYPIQVKYQGNNPVIEKGTVTIHHDEPVPDTTTTTTVTGSDGKPQTVTVPVHHPNITYDKTVSFDVKFKVQQITVSGDASGTISGDSGTVNIQKEGKNLHLSAIGTWAQPEYTLPSAGQYETVETPTIPQPPAQPTGNSGSYNIDWTKPFLDMDSPSPKWVNQPLDVNIKAEDQPNLSGLKTASWDVTDSSHYGRNSNGTFNGRDKIHLIDGIYNIKLDAEDNATNTNTKSNSTYYVDTTKPSVNFSVSPGIFQGNGVTRKASTAGQGDGFYGTLSYSDNLSGVNNVQYSWTFGTDDTGAYTTIYTNQYTYNDRYMESLSSEIEKPVGDNLYLHVKVIDTAGNENDSTFGPYEDPIKLKNFRVTDVRDPNWDRVFWKDDTFTQKTGNYYDAPRLPIDWNSNPFHPSSGSDHPTGAPKKGYAFYYQLTSEYLYRLNDKVIITPTFYWTDGTSKRIPIDLYYTTGINTLVKAGSIADKQQFNMTMNDITMNGDKNKILIGNLQKEILFDSVRLHQYNVPYAGWKGNIQYQYGKEQYWYGKYFIPATSRVYPKGSKVNPKNELKNGYIIINFQIEGDKNGIETLSSYQTFTYVPDQWRAEGGPKYAPYQSGDVMVNDNKYSVLDDYDSKGTQ